MHYVFLVHIVERQKHLENNLGCVSFLESFYLEDAIIELTTFKKLRDYVIVTFVLLQLEDAHNMWVICFLQDSEFTLLKSEQDLMLLNLLLVDNFYRSLLVSNQVVSQYDFAKGASPDGLLNVVEVLNSIRTLKSFEVF